MDFTLYSTADGSLIMKAMSSEEEFKVVDIVRFFVIAMSQNESLFARLLEKLANEIRAAHPAVAYPEIKSDDATISR